MKTLPTLPTATRSRNRFVTIQQGVPTGLQGPWVGCGVSPPFPTSSQEAAQEKGGGIQVDTIIGQSLHADRRVLALLDREKGEVTPFEPYPGL